MSNVRGFKEVVGPNGEVIFEFVSDVENDSGDSSSSEEDVNYVPPAAALARRNAIPNLDTATDWVENLPDVYSSSNEDFPSLDSSSSSSSPDSPPRSEPESWDDSFDNLRTTPGNNDGAVAGPSRAVQSSEGQPIPLAFGRSLVQKRRMRPTKRKRRKGAKKPVIKKKVPRKPKILAPMTIRRNITRWGDEKRFKQKNLRGPHKVGILKTGEEVEKTWKLGVIELCVEGGLFLFKGSNLHFENFDNNNVRDVFPNIHSMQFIVTNENCVLLVTQELDVSGEVAASIPRPPGKVYKNRILNYIDVEHYYFDVEVKGDLPAALFEGLRNKELRLNFESYRNETCCLTIQLGILDSAVLPDHDLESMPAVKSRPRRNVFAFLFGMDTSMEKIESQGKEDTEWFYGQVHKYHEKEILPDAQFPLQHSCLNPVLRNYQKNAVKWMLCKEGVLNQPEALGSSVCDGYLKTVSEVTATFMHKMSVPVQLEDVTQDDTNDRFKYAFYNPYIGYLSWSKPSLPTVPLGGILADEMGLGKTVEILSLILLHPAPCVKKEVIKIDSSSTESEADSDDSSPAPRRKKTKSSKTSSRTGNRKKRAASPFEFFANESSTDKQGNNSDEEEEIQTAQLGKRKRARIESSDDDSSENETPTRCKSSRKSKWKVEDAPVKTYDRVKPMYEAALEEYSTLNVVRPKFHGTFFDTTIRREAMFECLCGSAQTRRQKVLRCTKCLSSQHAECVNFDIRRSGSSYLCPHCEVSGPPINVKATLIITPTTISHQWIQEIQKHIRNQHLRILFYKGVSKHGYFPPYKFAEYDIVITTYAVLSSDLSFVDLPHANSESSRRFRHGKRFLTTPSSMPVVYWWRICLDEAQMVEGLTTKMAQMASRLQGAHRWCVTGTPINKGLEDLHGLVAFLGISPIDDDFWWENLIKVPFFQKDTSLLFELFGQLIWRTAKRSVLAQLGIPKQTEAFHWLQFSPVEMHFYKRQYEACSSKIITKIARLKEIHGHSIVESRLSSLDRRTLQLLLQPFLELRQACCHPQMVKGNTVSLKIKGTMTMEDLLDQLIKKTKIQCADDHRLVIAALNGLAGLYILSMRWAEAAGSYRSVLQSAEKNKDNYSTDSLQLLHALENLAEILDGAHPSVGFTLNDDNLRPQAEEIRKKYLDKYSKAVKEAQEVVEPVTNAVMHHMENFVCKSDSWWIAVLRRALETHKNEDLIARIKDDLTYKAKIFKRKTNSMANSFHNASGLQYLMIEKIQQLEEQRDDVMGGLDELLTRGPEVFVETAVACHLRGQTGVQGYYKEKETGFRCNLCLYHDRFLEYEALLFSTIENIKINRTGRNRQMANYGGNSELTSEERAMVLMREEEELIETTEHVNMNILLDQRRQTWADSDVEKIIKALLGFAKLNGCSMAVINDGSNHVKLFEVMKKEFRLLRILWRQIYDQVSAIDELSQATTRLRIQAEGELEQGKSPTKKTIKALSSGITEKADKIMTINVIQRHEIDLKIEQFQGDCEMGKDSLSIHLGQLIYLESLHKNGYGKKGAFNNDDCPVCASPLGHRWCVLICGHSFCTDCIKEISNRNHSQVFQCPLCRATIKMATVSFIDTRVDEDEPTNFQGPSTSTAVLPATKPVEVKGSHSTKVESVVETLLRLQESHPGEKCLIFSAWTDVLEIIGGALEKNDIRYCFLAATAKNKFHEILQRFKTREDIQALLMPLNSGAKGLNLIEATHVLLVEPIFNIASELQAIGRVHRIGQTKPTYVHRFYVKNTIEENLYQILRNHDVSSDEEGMLTIADLQQLVTNSSGIHVSSTTAEVVQLTE